MKIEFSQCVGVVGLPFKTFFDTETMVEPDGSQLELLVHNSDFFNQISPDRSNEPTYGGIDHTITIHSKGKSHSFRYFACDNMTPAMNALCRKLEKLVWSGPIG
ncbi:MAG: hypothetical protein KDK78_02080 [Chlamydiia bacterium]|nr:hypothetical protein [Chlamydiia bacterium]